MKRLFNLIVIFMLTAPLFGQNVLDSLLHANRELLDPVISNPDKYEVQILYTQIERDENGTPHFTEHKFNVDPQQYFYPASSVKTAACIAALEKLNELHIPGLDMNTPLTIDSVYSGQTPVTGDSTSKSGKASIAHYIKKISLVSDNDGYNRLYEFVGQKGLNERMHKRGIEGVRLVHRLSVFLSDDENRHTNPFTFYLRNGSKITFDEQVSDFEYEVELKDLIKGKGYYSGGELINEPMDFSQKNYFSIEALQGMLKRIMFPEVFDESERFNLTDEQYEFLREYMSMYPSHSYYPAYPDMPDAAMKSFWWGETQDMPDYIKYYAKSGLAYGYLIDNAYIVDKTTGIEFMLTATVHVNEDGIYNDDEYEYDEIGLPFMKNLGKIIYEWERD